MSNDFSGLPGIGILASRLVGFDAELVAPAVRLVTSSVTTESVPQHATRRMDMNASPPDESPVRAPKCQSQYFIQRVLGRAVNSESCDSAAARWPAWSEPTSAATTFEPSSATLEATAPRWAVEVTRWPVV